MNEHEKQLDFKATIKMAQAVSKYYNGNQQAVLEWWNTPQEHLDGKTPYMVVDELHGYKLREFCKTVQNKLLMK